MVFDTAGGQRQAGGNGDQETGTHVGTPSVVFKGNGEAEPGLRAQPLWPGVIPLTTVCGIGRWQNNLTRH